MHVSDLWAEMVSRSPGLAPPAFCCLTSMQTLITDEIGGQTLATFEKQFPSSLGGRP
jgi:hypothetical protein